MRTLLVLTTFVTIIFIAMTFYLLRKIRSFYEKLEYVDEADKWHKLAVTDDLTGIYNRNAYNLQIEDYINKRRYEEKSLGIILFDVDDFKRFNDTKGHLAGDEVLKKVAKTLLEVFPEPQYRVFRIGGDEFSVLSDNVSENEIIRRLLVLKKHLELNGNIGLSKGYSVVKDNIEETFKYADEMLYADKLSKKYKKDLY